MKEAGVEGETSLITEKCRSLLLLFLLLALFLLLHPLITEKCSLMERSLEMIELGLGEATVMAALATHLLHQHGGLDILVNNAGIAYKRDSKAQWASKK